MGSHDNNSHDSWDGQHLLIATSIFTVFGLPGNLLIIILILRAKHAQKCTTTTRLLLSLTIADIVYLLTTQILHILVYLHETHDKKGPTLMLFLVVSKIVAKITLAMIALERYNALVKTMKPLVNITRKKITCGIIITWSIALVLCLPAIFFRMPKQMTCLPDAHWYIYVTSSLLLVFGYVTPFVIVVFCYLSILKGLYIDRTILAENITDEATLKENKRLIRILVVITLLFLACNLPMIAMIMKMHDKCKKSGSGYFIISMILGCLSSALNPYLYGLHSENYRSQVKQLFCKKKEEENTRFSPEVFNTKL